MRDEQELPHCEGVHHLPSPVREGQVCAVFLPPDVGCDEDLHESFVEPETAVELLPLSPPGSRLSENKDFDSFQLSFVQIPVRYVPIYVLNLETVSHTLHIQCHCPHVHPCRAPTGNPWSQSIFHTVHTLSIYHALTLMITLIMFLQADLSLKLFPTPYTYLVFSVSCQSCSSATCSRMCCSS